MRSAATGRFGYAWSPKNLAAIPTADFNAQTDALLVRLAAAIADSGDTPEAACGASWCSGSLAGAAATAAWSTFGAWKPSRLAFTSPEQTVAPGAASTPLTVELQTNAGTAYTAGVPVDVALSSSSPTGELSASPDGPVGDDALDPHRLRREQRRASTSGTPSPARRRSPRPLRGRRLRRRRSRSAPLPRLRPLRRAAEVPLPISSSRRARRRPRRPSAARSRTRSRSGTSAARLRVRSSPSSSRRRSPTPAVRATAGRAAPARPLSAATSTSSPAISLRRCGSAASSASRGRSTSRLSPRHSRPTRSRRTTRPASPRSSGLGQRSGVPTHRPPHAPRGRHADAADAGARRRDRVRPLLARRLRPARGAPDDNDLDAADHTARGKLARGHPIDEGTTDGRGAGPARRRVPLQGAGRRGQADPGPHVPRPADGRSTPTAGGDA